MCTKDTDFKKYATEYNPIKIGSIDGTDTEPHDRALVRAIYADYRPNKLVQGDPCHTLFIGRLNPRTAQDTIISEFEKFGKIRKCRLVKDIVTGQSKQYAFVEFESTASTEKALQVMHKECIDHSEIIVEREAERRLRGWKPRRLGGGFGGKKESGQLRFGCRDRPFRKPILMGDKELKRWLKSFTKVELLLVSIGAVLFVILISFLVFLLLHFLSCTDETGVLFYPAYNNDTTTAQDEITTLQFASDHAQKPNDIDTTLAPRTGEKLLSNVTCTWKVSRKTPAYNRYFYLNSNKNVSTGFGLNDMSISDTISNPKYVITTIPIQDSVTAAATQDIFDSVSESVDTGYSTDISDDEDALEFNAHIMALVKLKPPRDIIFGCILTIVNKEWLLTAASCIEAIDEVDSLDNFIIMEDYGMSSSKTHAVADIVIHPLYQGANRSFDMVAIKSEDGLLGKTKHSVQLPHMLDYFLITIAESFTILGYGPFRTIDNGPLGRSLRRTQVYNLPSKQCPVVSDSWAFRTLSPGETLAQAPCGAAPLCAGALFARGTPCNYCAGTPLLRAPVLFGLMSSNPQCGVSCEPQIYVNIALVSDWLLSVVDNK